MIQNEIIDTDDLKAMKIVFDKNHKFRPETFHLTLFRVKNKQKEDELMDISLLNEFKDYNLGQTELKFVDISTRFEYMDDQFYQPLWRIILN